MKCGVKLSIKVSGYALTILELLRVQNQNLSFDIDSENQSLVLSGELFHFKDYSNDWDSLEDIESSLREVE